jgi:hypothetical protein
MARDRFRDATPATVTSGTLEAGPSSAVVEIRAVPSTPMRSGSTFGSLGHATPAKRGTLQEGTRADTL